MILINQWSVECRNIPPSFQTTIFLHRYFMLKRKLNRNRQLQKLRLICRIWQNVAGRNDTGAYNLGLFFRHIVKCKSWEYVIYAESTSFFFFWHDYFKPCTKSHFILYQWNIRPGVTVCTYCTTYVVVSHTQVSTWFQVFFSLVQKLSCTLSLWVGISLKRQHLK